MATVLGRSCGMNVRESLNSHPGIGAAIAVVVVLAGGWMIYHQTRPEGEPPAMVTFYTDDDGATWFADSPTRVPPYDHNGKQAVRCFVFQAADKPFVGYLREDTPELARRVNANLGSTNDELAAGMLVKRPGDKQWIPMSDPRSQAIVSVGAGTTEVDP
jgi:hypothetical protein